MKKLLLVPILFSLFGCASTTETDEIPGFAFNENEVSAYRTAYRDLDFEKFPFIIVADGGPSGDIIMENSNQANGILLKKHGVVFMALVDREGRVASKKLIAGYRNMRGNNAVYYNQVVSKMPFEKANDEDVDYREFVVPITLTYPLETF